MAGCGRRFAVRAFAACFAAMLGTGSTALATEAATKQVQITVQVGYHNTVKLGQWVPVVVDLTNSGPAIDGTLEVQASNSTGNGGPPIGAATYQTPISLAIGATKHVRTYVTLDNPGTVAARVVQNGRVVANQEASVPNTSSGLMAGVISDQPSALDSSRFGFAIGRATGRPSQPRRTVRLGPRAAGFRPARHRRLRHRHPD